MKTSASVWTVHPTIASQKCAASAETEAVGRVMTKERVSGDMGHVRQCLIMMLTRDQVQVRHNVTVECPL